MPRVSKRVQKITPPTFAARAKTPDRHGRTTKADGSPLDDWSEIGARVLAKREAEKAAGLPAPNAKRPCQAQTTGVHGPQRPCSNLAIPGLTVCWAHGGSTSAARAAVRKRAIEELDPTLSRAIALRDQEDHLPTALNAVNTIFKLAGVAQEPKHAPTKRPVINIGVGIGGMPTFVKAQAQILEPVVEAEVARGVDGDED